MSLPNQMYTYELNGLKGYKEAAEWAVDKVAYLDSTVTPATTYRGSAVHLDPTNQTWKLGVGTISTTSAPITFFLLQNGFDFDVVGDDGNMVGAPPTGVLPNLPRMTGVSSACGYELETSQFTGTPNCGDLLTANSSGVLLNYVSGAAILCGVGSDSYGGTAATGNSNSGSSVFVNDFGVNVLRFHAVYIPKFS